VKRIIIYSPAKTLGFFYGWNKSLGPFMIGVSKKRKGFQGFLKVFFTNLYETNLSKKI
jgi:hypothetical protein